MALVKCPECGKNVSDKAISCPSCGYVLSKANITDANKHNKDSLKKYSRMVIGGIFLVGILILGSHVLKTYTFNKELKEKEELYNEAFHLIGNREYDKAIPILEELQGYKDADTLMMEANKPPYEKMTPKEKKFYNSFRSAVQWEQNHMTIDFNKDHKIRILGIEEIRVDQSDFLMPDTSLSKGGSGWKLQIASFESSDEETIPDQEELEKTANYGKQPYSLYVLGEGKAPDIRHDTDYYYNDWMLFRLSISFMVGDINKDNAYNLDIINEAIKEDFQ